VDIGGGPAVAPADAATSGVDDDRRTVRVERMPGSTLVDPVTIAGGANGSDIVRRTAATRLSWCAVSCDDADHHENGAVPDAGVPPMGSVATAREATAWTERGAVEPGSLRTVTRAS
jgi:hypothetical protein